MNKLTLRINGTAVAFYSASVNYSLDQLAHTFTCSIPPMNITNSLPVEFYLNDRLILTGQIDGVDSSTDASSQALTISGRSKSANMIDSRITMDALYDQPVDKLLRKLAAPFNLDVQCLVKSLENVEEFQINAESPVENVAQVIREQGFVLVERNGVLTIENPAHATIQALV